MSRLRHFLPVIIAALSAHAQTGPEPFSVSRSAGTVVSAPQPPTSSGQNKTQMFGHSADPWQGVPTIGSPAPGHYPGRYAFLESMDISPGQKYRLIEQYDQYIYVRTTLSVVAPYVITQKFADLVLSAPTGPKVAGGTTTKGKGGRIIDPAVRPTNAADGTEQPVDSASSDRTLRWLMDREQEIKELEQEIGVPPSKSPRYQKYPVVQWPAKGSEWTEPDMREWTSHAMNRATEGTTLGQPSYSKEEVGSASPKGGVSSNAAITSGSSRSSATEDFRPELYTSEEFINWKRIEAQTKDSMNKRRSAAEGVALDGAVTEMFRQDQRHYEIYSSTSTSADNSSSSGPTAGDPGNPSIPGTGSVGIRVREGSPSTNLKSIESTPSIVERPKNVGGIYFPGKPQRYVKSPGLEAENEAILKQAEPAPKKK